MAMPDPNTWYDIELDATGSGGDMACLSYVVDFSPEVFRFFAGKGEFKYQCNTKFMFLPVDDNQYVILILFDKSYFDNQIMVLTENITQPKAPCPFTFMSEYDGSINQRYRVCDNKDGSISIQSVAT